MIETIIISLFILLIICLVSLVQKTKKINRFEYDEKIKRMEAGEPISDKNSLFQDSSR